MSLWSQISLQDSNSPVMESIIIFYDHAMLIVMIIIGLIFYILFFMFNNKLSDRFMFEGQLIEIIWTIVPVFILIFIAFPSLKILYLTDEINNPVISVKIIGHQWYWSYEYNDFINLNFDSFIVNSEDLSFHGFRLLDVDNRIILPINNQIRLLVSSLDVIHSFALPSIGLKVDAVPGRINQVGLNINRVGVYFGQCSEICGVNHRFIPIVIESVDPKNFMKWVFKNYI